MAIQGIAAARQRKHDQHQAVSTGHEPPDQRDDEQDSKQRDEVGNGFRFHGAKR